MLAWRLCRVALLGVRSPRATLGLAWVRSLLLASVRGRAVLTVVALTLLAVAAWPLLSIPRHLLSVLHAAHASRRSDLHRHGIPLRGWRSVALSWVRASLLGSRPCGRPLLLLLGVRIGCSIWLASHLPYLVHGAWRLVSVWSLSSVSRAHGRRMVDPLLPTRMDPTILTATHISWSLIGPFLIVIVSLGVIRVAPGRAWGCQKLI